MDLCRTDGRCDLSSANGSRPRSGGPEVVMLLTALINILGHDNRGDRPTEVLLMAAYGERGVLDRPNMRVMRRRNGALQGVTWRTSLYWEVLGLINQVRCLWPPSRSLG